MSHERPSEDVGAVKRQDEFALALKESHEQIHALQRERDSALHRASQQEAEVARLTLHMKRGETEHRALADENQQQLIELQQLRHGHQEYVERLAAANMHERDRAVSDAKQHHVAELAELRRGHQEYVDKLARLKSEVEDSRSKSVESRSHLQRLISDQKEQIAALHDASSCASRELAQQSSRASEFSELLFAVLRERVYLLRFVMEVLSALQTLFYNPTPLALITPRSEAPSVPAHASAAQVGTKPKRTRSTERLRTNSVERLRANSIHKHTGCFACSAAKERSQSPGARRASSRPTEGRQDDAAELRRLTALAIEAEMAEASERCTAQIQRVKGEAERSAALVGCSGTSPRREVYEMDARRAVNAWAEQERNWKECGSYGSRSAPRLDWEGELKEYREATGAMDAKFTQLSKLMRACGPRRSTAKK